MLFLSLLLVPRLPLTWAASSKISYSSEINRGDLISVTSWHARTLTDISWDIPASMQDSSHLIIFIWNEAATELWRFGETNVSSRADSPPLNASSSSSSTQSPSADSYTADIAGDEFVPLVCTGVSDAFESSPKDIYFTEENQALVTPALADGKSWWYTASLDQDAPNATSPTSAVGEASVLLSEPGWYSVCLFLADSTCALEECVNITVYQPPYDFLEVRTLSWSPLLDARAFMLGTKRWIAATTDSVTL